MWDTPLRDIMDRMEIQIEKIHKYLIAFNEILKERLAAGLLPVYDAGYIALDKQYLTIGVNGLVEGAEALNIPVEADNPEYIAYVDAVLSPIYAANRAARTSELMFNTEMVPAEGLGVKNAAWDKESKLYVPRDCYNNYFFVAEDPTVNVLDKLRFHGKAFTRYLDGGSACHINLDEHLTKEQYLLLLNAAIRTGCNYLTFNIPNTLCNACGHISKHRLDACPKCGSRDLDYATRIIGYLKLISRFAYDRQIEAGKGCRRAGWWQSVMRICTDRHMQSSIRVMPGCYITGQAAGMAAAVLCAAHSNNVHSIDVHELQQKLVQFGAYLPNFKG